MARTGRANQFTFTCDRCQYEHPFTVDRLEVWSNGALVLGTEPRRDVERTKLILCPECLALLIGFINRSR